MLTSNGHQVQPTIAPLFAGIMEDIHLLFRQEIALVRSEAADSLRETVRSVSYFALSATFLGVFLLLFFVGASFLVAQLFALPLWGAFVGMAWLALCLGVTFYFLGMHRRRLMHRKRGRL